MASDYSVGGRVLNQMRANLGHVGVIFNVVIAVGERETALVNVGDDHIGIVQIGLTGGVEQRIRADHLHVRNGINQRLLVLHCGNAVELATSVVEKGKPFLVVVD